jgi:nucleoid DNA-binding protein
MNKQELIEAVAERAGMSQADARGVVDAIFSPDPSRGLISGRLNAGEKVAISGFGTFEARQRKGRTGRNPQTGESIQIAPHKYPGFHPGKTLKEELNR